MNKILIQPRVPSPGELAAKKRLEAFTKAKEAKLEQRTGKGITAVTKPPLNQYGALMLAPNND